MPTTSHIPRYPAKDSPLGITISSMARVEDGRDPQEVPHRHDYHILIWVESAQGTHYVDAHVFPLANRQMFFLSPEQVHLMEVAGSPQGCVLTFGENFLQQAGIALAFLQGLQLFFDCDDPVPLQVSEAEGLEIRACLEEIAKEMAQERPYQAEQLGAQLKLLLIRCKRLMAGQQILPERLHSRSAEIVRQFKRLLNAQFRTLHKVSNYAEALTLSPSYLNEVLKQETGYSAKQLIQNRLSLEARQLAHHSSGSMKEIAYELGFDDVAHFSKFFKAQVGTSFSAYRKDFDKNDN